MLNIGNVSLHSTVVQAKGNIVSDMGGEKVMLSIDKGKYYNLGEIGGAIWGQMQVPTLVSKIIDHLMAEYKVEREECEKQVLDFLKQLIHEELVECN